MRGSAEGNRVSSETSLFTEAPASRTSDIMDTSPMHPRLSKIHKSSPRGNGSPI
jgi:hypothetical protein